MAETNTTEDPLFGRIRGRINPLESASDFKAYEDEKAKATFSDGQDAFRALVHLPPLNDGMSEFQRNSLIKEYTAMLDSLVKLDTDLKSEEAKTGRNRQTMWGNALGQILKWDAARDATKGGTLEAVVGAAAKRMEALGVQQQQFGTAGLDERVAQQYSPAFQDLARNVNPSTGQVVDQAEYERVLTQSLNTITDPREIAPFLEKAARVSGKSPKEYITGLSELFPPSSDTAKLLSRRMSEGSVATKQAVERQKEFDTEVVATMKDMKLTTSGGPAYIKDMVQMALLGVAGIDVPNEKLATAFGLTPEAYAYYTSVGKEGDDVEVAPDGTVTRKAKSVTSSPFIEDNRKRIIAEIDGLRAGSSPRFVQIKKAMLASEAFQTFKKNTGIYNDDVAFETWAQSAKQAAMDSKHDARVARDKAILRGDVKAGLLPEIGARVSSAFRDLFGGKKEAGLSDPSRAEQGEGPTGNEPDDPTIPFDLSSLGKKPTPEAKPEADKEAAKKDTSGAPGAEPTKSEENPSAAMTSGSSSSSSKTEAAGEAKSETGKTSEYRIVNDPRNMDYIYRQYADGRLELIGTPNDKSVSPKNPRSVTGSGKAKMDKIIGAYEKPETLSDQTRDGIDLDELQPSIHKQAEDTATPGRAKQLVDAPDPLEGIKLSGLGLTKSGPALKLVDGEVQRVEPKKYVTPVGKIESEDKGKMDNSVGEVDALTKLPKIDRAKATAPVDIAHERKVEADTKALGEWTEAEKKRREKYKTAIENYATEE